MTEKKSVLNIILKCVVYSIRVSIAVTCIACQWTQIELQPGFINWAMIYGAGDFLYGGARKIANGKNGSK